MPISSQLSHVDAVDLSTKDLQARRLSNKDMYRHGLFTIAGQLDALRIYFEEDSPDGHVAMIGYLSGLLSKVESVTQQGIPTTRHAGRRSTLDESDIMLAAYATMRDGVADLYRAHPGKSHPGTCLTCRCLWTCAGVIGAIEWTLAAAMRDARSKVDTVKGGQQSHVCTLVPVQVGDKQYWHVTCVHCGVVDVYPINSASNASKAATRHRRMKAGARVPMIGRA